MLAVPSTLNDLIIEVVVVIYVTCKELWNRVVYYDYMRYRYYNTEQQNRAACSSPPHF